MLTLIKWIAGALLTLGLLLAIAVIVIPRVVNPNDYRDTLTELVKEQTDRDLIVQGGLSISVFPWLGVRTQGVSFSQPSQIGQSQGPMLKADTAQLRVKLLPLLSQRLEIDTVVLERPRLHLITMPDGSDSFSGLAGSSQTEEALAGTEVSDPSRAVALVIQGVDISDGTIIWDDRKANQKYTARNLNISTGNLIGASLADFDISGVVIDASDPQEITLSSRGKARIDTSSLELTANDVDGALSKVGQSFKFTVADMQVDQAQNVIAKNVEVRGNMESSQADSSGIKFDSQFASANLVSGTGELTLDALRAELQVKMIDQPDADLNLELPNLVFNLNTQRLGSNSTLSLNGKLDDRPIILTVTNLDADLPKQIMSARLVQLRSKDIDAKIGGLKATQIFDEPVIRGKITTEPFDATQAMRDFEVDYLTQDDTALREVVLSSDFIAGLDKIDLSNMQLQIDQSQLLGQFSAESFDKPKLRFNLELDAIDLDRYLPKTEEGTPANEQTGSTAEALVVPMALFNELAANGQFKANRLISGGIELNDIDVQITSTPGKVSIVPRANLYDGKMDGTMEFSQTGDTSKLQIKNEIDLISLSKFLQAADVTDQLSGIGTLAIDVIVTEKDGVQSNSGTINLFAKNGALKGVDIKNIIESGYQQYNQLRGKETVTQEGSGEINDETRFAELIGTFNINDFILSNSDFKMKAPLFRISGQGDIDIKTETIDYLVNVAVVKSTNGQGGEALDKLKGITLPVRFRGSMFSPSYSLDMKALYKGLVKHEIDKKKSEYLEEKLGIESEEPLSTKEILQQALLNKLNKKNRNSQPEETITIESPNSVQPPANPSKPTPDVIDYPEETITIQAPGSSQQATAADQRVPDVSSDPNAEQTLPEPEDNRTNKQKRNDELKRLLLEELFN